MSGPDSALSRASTFISGFPKFTSPTQLHPQSAAADNPTGENSESSDDEYSEVVEELKMK